MIYFAILGKEKNNVTDEIMLCHKLLMYLVFFLQKTYSNDDGNDVEIYIELNQHKIAAKIYLDFIKKRRLRSLTKED